MFGDSALFVRYACDTRAYGVEVNVAHAGEHRRFIQQGLAFEAAFPKTTGATVLLIGPPGEVLIEATHDPGDIGKPLASGLG